MPTISIFFGIVIRMNFGDHAPPHVHAEYQGREALFDIRTAEIIAGDISRPGKRMVREWIMAHRPDLMEDWQLASAGQPTFRIPGLDND
jgi:hypothetical protein